ncbi:MAG TPA: acyltransferase [Candidatus Gastranaerophilales bacterium]|nr:acyltransferase [Candidatus Gastranaerophilales bacterium]
MGLLRLILALNVVIAHAGGQIFKLTSVGGIIAVETFFIISGFYMSLILSGKYKGLDKYGLFISNRLLRLFPVYLVVLILAVTAYMFSYKLTGSGFALDYWNDNASTINLFSLILIAITSITLLGQEIFCFTGLNPETGALFLSTNFLSEAFQPYKFMFIPQAWTLSLELMFYFIAPFLINLKNRYILLMIAVSLALRFFAYSFGFSHEPWNYRFFPFEIAFFLLGIICFRLYEKYKNIEISKKSASILLLSVFSYIILFQYIPVELGVKKWVLYAAMIPLAPILFKISKNNQFDRFIGELSYPVYICHVLIINLLSLAFPDPPKYFPLLAMVLSIALSIILNKLIADPVERFRQKRVESSLKPETISDLSANQAVPTNV